MSAATDVLQLALKLSLDERAMLAHELLLSLETEPIDEEVDEAWAEEVEARAARLDRGETTLTDWEEARERIERSLEKGKDS